MAKHRLSRNTRTLAYGNFDVPTQRPAPLIEYTTGDDGKPLKIKHPFWICKRHGIACDRLSCHSRWVIVLVVAVCLALATYLLLYGAAEGSPIDESFSNAEPVVHIEELACPVTT